MHPDTPTLPHLCGRAVLTDGGLETTLVFHDGIDLPAFAAFTLLDSDTGRARLNDYYSHYLGLAARCGRGLLLETPTWRANADWGAPLGYDAEALDRLNRDSVRWLRALVAAAAARPDPLVISGNIGPRGDGYVAASRMSPAEARDYHRAQIHSFAHAGVDLVSAYTLNYSDEAIGIVLAAQAEATPVVISLTVETDGRLPSGETLSHAIDTIDEATAGGPVYYMINCAHPSHFAHVLEHDGPWRHRIRGLRANASCLSHAELDVATTLDDGDPVQLGQAYEALRKHLPALAVIGGCCGTDHRHVEAISHAFAG